MLYIETEFNKARIPLYKIIVLFVLFIYLNIITLVYIYRQYEIYAEYRQEVSRIQANIVLLKEKLIMLEEQDTEEKVQEWLESVLSQD